MDRREEPYDPYPNDQWPDAPRSAGLGSAGLRSAGPGSAGIAPNEGTSTGGNSAFPALQGQIDDTINTLKKTILSAEERGGKIEDLQDKTDNLATTSHDFNRGANRMRKKMWWKNMTMRVWIIIGIIVLLIVIIVPAVVASKHA